MSLKSLKWVTVLGAVLFAQLGYGISDECFEKVTGQVLNISDYSHLKRERSEPVSAPQDPVALDPAPEAPLEIIQQHGIEHFVLLVPIQKMREFSERGSFRAADSYDGALFAEEAFPHKYFTMWAQAQDADPLAFYAVEDLAEFKVDPRIFQHSYNSMIQIRDVLRSEFVNFPLARLNLALERERLSQIKFFWNHEGRPLPSWSILGVGIPQRHLDETRELFQSSHHPFVQELSSEIYPAFRPPAPRPPMLPDGSPLRRYMPPPAPEY